jgi:hydrogenase expression/formation protein HypD
MAIGFETTAPSTALTVLQAAQEGVKNFAIFCNHVIIIPAIKAILDSPDLRLDGFIGPGHGVCLQSVGRESIGYPDELPGFTPFHQEAPHGP